MMSLILVTLPSCLFCQPLTSSWHLTLQTLQQQHFVSVFLRRFCKLCRGLTSKSVNSTPTYCGKVHACADIILKECFLPAFFLSTHTHKKKTYLRPNSTTKQSNRHTRPIGNVCFQWWAKSE